MTPLADRQPLRVYARTAGLLYLIIIVCGIASEALIRSSLIVQGDPATTAGNILASPALFRTGFVADTIMLLSDVAIAVLFYTLLKPVNKTLAMAAACFRLTQAAILAFNLLNYYAALLLLSGKEFASAFETTQLHAQAMMFLELHSHGYDIGLLFFAVSSILLGYLVIRADYFPSYLGMGLIAAAMVYLAGGFTRFLFPEYLSSIAPLYAIPLIAELAFCLWLLTKSIAPPSQAD